MSDLNNDFTPAPEECPPSATARPTIPEATPIPIAATPKDVAAETNVPDAISAGRAAPKIAPPVNITAVVTATITTSIIKIVNQTDIHLTLKK